MSLNKQRIYKSWRSMLDRCNKKWCHAYPTYGERGIKVCERWHSYLNFVSDMGEMPDGHVLDRIDNNSSYRPGNCRWVTKAESNKNKRNVTKIPWNGDVKTISEVAKEIGISRGALHYRIKKWGLARALAEPKMAYQQVGYEGAKKRWGYKCAV